MRAGMTLPRIERIDSESVPEPYKSLLVHSQDMTPTLEEFHGDTIHLDAPQRGCVLGLERVGELRDALAYHPL